MNPKIAYLKISDLKYSPQVYRSSRVPGWVSWVGILQLANKDILVGFNEIIGDPNRPEPEIPPEMKGVFPNGFYNMQGLDNRFKIIRAVDKGPWFNKWELYYEETWEGYWPSSHGLLLQTGKGTLLKATQGRRIPKKYPCGVLSQSRDNGKTWNDYYPVCDYNKWKIDCSRVIQLRDGRLLMAAEGIKIGGPETYSWVSSYLLTSEDDGKSWSEPIEAMKSDGTAGYPEPAITELANGDILMMVRVENLVEYNPLDAWNPENNPNRNRKQTRLVKKGNTWIPGKIEPLEIPAGGHPELLMTREGILLYISPEGFWGSIDEGREWTRIETLPYALYYPCSVQLDDGRILVVGHNGGDCPFPPPEDMVLWKTSFRIQATGGNHA